jgi:AcrR family transcriptional regulator
MGAIADRSAKEDRRQEILDAAFEEFSAKGYAGASMAAIARRARASKETLYAWFGNKETLFHTLFVSRLGGMVSRVNAVIADDPSIGNVLLVVAEDVIRFMLTTRRLTEATGAGEPSGKAQRLIGKTIAEERANFVAYLLRCREQGQIDFDDDPFELISVFVAMAQGEWSLRLTTGMLDELTDEMIRDHAQRVTRIFLKGIAPNPDRRSTTSAARPDPA